MRLLLALAFLPALALGCGVDSPPPGPETPPIGPGTPPPDPGVPPPPSGTVFDAAVERPGEWLFFPTEGAQCRDGSPTGLGFRYEPGATNLLIVLDGGGVCFDAATCENTRASYSRSDFEAQMARRGETGIVSRDPENPVAGWNAAFVPYCTGDLHGGTASSVVVDGVPGVQEFVGHENIEAYLDLLAPFVEQPERVLLAGASAGGYGALFSFDEVARRFPESDLALLSDSGPLLFDDTVFSPAFGTRIEALYGLSGTVPEAELFQPDGLQTLYAYYADTYPGATLALASYTDDPTIRSYLDAGLIDDEVTSDEFSTGLRDLVSQLPGAWHTYIASGEGHVFIAKREGYVGVKRTPNVSAWLADLLAGRGGDVELTVP